MTSIKPQQITFIIPGVENFDHTEILDFVQRAQSNLDLTLLEFAWIELLEKNKLVRVEELAEMIFGSAEPLERYCVHLLLSNDGIYFTVLESKSSFSVYRYRPAVQVNELLQMKHAKEAAKKELKEFVKLLKSAREMPSHSKPTKSSWRTEEKIRHRIESLEAYAIDKYYISPGLKRWRRERNSVWSPTSSGQKSWMDRQEEMISTVHHMEVAWSILSLRQFDRHQVSA
ncbi:Ribonuclease II [Forsythia ovata]|uniref:Ribonuclease II n=1 Tax=Forsythia ovata TaxID=205694 RepID=A0ABD1WMT8_9LAMI